MNDYSSPSVLKPNCSSRPALGPRGEGECLAFLLPLLACGRGGQINLGRNVWSRPVNLYQNAGCLCHQLIWKQRQPLIVVHSAETLAGS